MLLPLFKYVQNFFKNIQKIKTIILSLEFFRTQYHVMVKYVLCFFQILDNYRTRKIIELNSIHVFKRFNTKITINNKY